MKIKFNSDELHVIADILENSHPKLNELEVEVPEQYVEEFKDIMIEDGNGLEIESLTYNIKSLVYELTCIKGIIDCARNREEYEKLWKSIWIKLGGVYHDSKK